MEKQGLGLSASVLVLAAALAACSDGSGAGGNAEGNAGANARANAAAANGSAGPEPVYATYGVHNPDNYSSCTDPKCSYDREAGRPADPLYPAVWQSRWTMYRVFYPNYQKSLPPYKGPPPGLVAGRDYEASSGATYYDSTWKGRGGEGAMMEYYDKRCLPIFPGIANTFTCAFISLGDTAFFLTYPQDRPKGMPPVCLFSPLNHPPRRDFIKHLPYAKEDSAQLGGGAQAYSFWIGPDGKPMQTGVRPDHTSLGPTGGVLFGYAFAPVNGRMLPQSFYFSGFPDNPPNAPMVAQVYQGFSETKPDPAKTWNQVSGLDPAKLPACTVMGGGGGANTLKAGKRALSWFDIGRAGRKH